jgi:hypothetical protein
LLELKKAGFGLLERRFCFCLEGFKPLDEFLDIFRLDVSEFVASLPFFLAQSCE